MAGIDQRLADQSDHVALHMVLMQDVLKGLAEHISRGALGVCSADIEGDFMQRVAGDL